MAHTPVYKYDEVFYQYINRGAAASARVVIPALLDTLPIRVNSVLDVGCGAGAWLSIWKAQDAQVTGLDGDYITPNQLLIDPSEFTSTDLRESFDLRRRFDLVQSLEVAEHLPQDCAEQFVASLCSHGDLVLFSAATPGQGGEHHINEQPYSYWRRLFARQGFSMYDPVRPAIAGNKTVMDWYRYNLFLYVRDHSEITSAPDLACHHVPPASQPREFAPALYRLRKHIIRLLPPSASTALAIVKKNLFTLSLRLASRE